MIHDPRKMLVPDETGHGNNVVLRVNWNKAVKPSKLIEFNIAGKRAVVRREYLETLLFMMAEEEAQAKFVKSAGTHTRKHKVKVNLYSLATKDIRKGEMVIVPYWKEVDYDEAQYQISREKNTKTTII